ncbi:MaoC family dehydratase [Citreimonas sp.]|uniref:MaoC family dehydratase n=1 Tax=Citreimonas sp. TaxID=3036715 RepID=UPI004059975E
MTMQLPIEGQDFASRPRAMTRERMRWYVDAQATAVANDGKPRFGGPTIHDDDDYARAQGLPGIIADGMVSTNWMLALLVDTFGPAAATVGRLRTKYVHPVYEDDVLISRAKVMAVTPDEAGHRIALDIRCETLDGTPVTVGEAEVLLPHG